VGIAKHFFILNVKVWINFLFDFYSFFFFRILILSLRSGTRREEPSACPSSACPRPRDPLSLRFLVLTLGYSRQSLLNRGKRKSIIHSSHPKIWSSVRNSYSLLHANMFLQQHSGTSMCWFTYLHLAFVCVNHTPPNINSFGKSTWVSISAVSMSIVTETGRDQ
jgi:hypothetical protein